ncbi:MAG: hypothetical protein QOD53_622, partial [Thermoleophilaceae bacterium]|nr:hypothetical protein [Thermoleophilaceae bacterium]
TNIVVAVAFAIPAVFGDFRQGLVRRLANNRVLAYFGLISYGLYLYHWAVLQQLLSWRMHGDLGFMSSYATWLAVSLLATVVLGSLSYYLVERPALSLKRLVPLQPGREPDEALAEPAPVAPVTATPAS